MEILRESLEGREQIGLLEGDVVSGRATERHGLPSEEKEIIEGPVVPSLISHAHPACL